MTFKTMTTQLLSNLISAGLLGLAVWSAYAVMRTALELTSELLRPAQPALAPTPLPTVSVRRGHGGVRALRRAA